MHDYGVNLRSPKVDIHEFSMIPRHDVPRSSFRMQWQHKSTIQASTLIPFYCEEVLPGDSFNCSMSAFCRLATPIYPLMDNMDLETWFFFVPNRLVWVHWYRFMGEQENPADSISFTIPTITSAVGGFPRNSIFDYFGLPTVGQTGAGNTITVSALPFRGYNIIFNQWFRDENLVNAAVYGSTSSVGIQNMDDGPDPISNYGLLNPAKRHDYFTACLPWTQKGGIAVTLPLGTSATVKTQASNLFTGAQNPMNILQSSGTAYSAITPLAVNAGSQAASGTAGGAGSPTWYPSNLYADLSTATAATINAIRLAFQTQKLLERDARGGTRYTEIIRSHFGVTSPDMRLQRPEYLGGGKTPVTIAPVPQTVPSYTGGPSSPIGTLSAAGVAIARQHGFRQSFTEHGYIIGLCAVRTDMIYWQGIRRHWKRSTRYDFFFPVFANLGEKSVFNYEIWSDGSANDNLTFGFQENWAEYRYRPSYITGFFRSSATTPLDSWHLAQNFTVLPTLNSGFITDASAQGIQRAVAAGAAATNQQLLCDFFFDQKVARPMPLYSVPGLVDHF